MKSKKRPTKARIPRVKMDVDAFIAVYLETNHLGRAATAAGSRNKNASLAGKKILARPDVAARIKAFREVAAEKVQMTADRVIGEVARIAFADIRAYFNDDGTPKALSELDDDAAAVLVGLDVSETKIGEVSMILIKKYKLADKNSALDKAMRHLGLYKEDNKQQNEITALMDEINASDRSKLQPAPQ